MRCGGTKGTHERRMDVNALCMACVDLCQQRELALPQVTLGTSEAQGVHVAVDRQLPEHAGGPRGMQGTGEGRIVRRERFAAR